MVIENPLQLKEKIFHLIKNNGPSLPAHISRGTGLSMLFASAFLSELLSDKRIRLSNMKVGGSPLYLVQGQEPMLENFSHFLKSKEKDAYLLLKENKFLKDSEQQPAIRVALREIRDFAIPLRKNEALYWRYFTIPENEFSEKAIEITKSPIIETPQEIIKTEVKEMPQEIKKENIEKLGLDIGLTDKTKDKEETKVIRRQKKKASKKPVKSKKNERFFNKIKEFLQNNSYEILDIENFNKNSLILKVKKNNKEKIVVAYNKKRVTETDIINAYKKANDYKLEFIILNLGTVNKKIKDFIEAIKGLSEIEKVE